MPAGEKTKELWKNPKYREHMSEVHKGQTTWCKGLTNETDERIRKKSESQKGEKNHMFGKTGNENPFYGKHHTKKAKEEIGKAGEGRIPWNKNKKGVQKSNKKGMTWEELYGIEQAKEMKLKLKKANQGKKLTKEHIKNSLRRRIPSSLEEKFMGIIDKHNLPYKYVGDGSFFIDRFNPDFINTNSEKIAVEVYARYYKKRHNQDIEKWKRERGETFKEYGWSIIYFDETQVREDCVLSILSKDKKRNHRSEAPTGAHGNEEMI